MNNAKPTMRERHPERICRFCNRLFQRGEAERMRHEIWMHSREIEMLAKTSLESVSSPLKRTG
jgi:hypothetical protein